jgi:DNA-binding response OmpR family regulator
LIVDAEPALRQMASEQAEELGAEVDVCAGFRDGLAKVQTQRYDLMILDNTELLKALRDGGDQTPVLLLGEDMKSSTVVEIMRLGVEDYLLKPIAAETLENKLFETLMQIESGGGNSARARVGEPTPPAAPGSRALPASAAGQPAPTSARPAAPARRDVLLIDDSPRVHELFRQRLPERLSLETATDAESALRKCESHDFRVVIIDLEIPDCDTKELVNRLRVAHKDANLMGLGLRDMEPDASKHGRLDGHLYKPFAQDEIDEFTTRHFAEYGLVVVDDNVLSLGHFEGRDDRIEGYFRRLGFLLQTSLRKLAAECFDDIVVDFRGLPAKPDHVHKLARKVERQAKKMGMQLKLVGTREIKTLLEGFPDTAKLSVYESKEANKPM